MIICVCNNVSDKVIESIVEQYDINNIEDLQKNIKVCDQCKKCTCMIEDSIVNAQFCKEKIAA